MLRNTRATIKLTKKRSAVNFGGALHDIRMNGCEKAWEFTRISIFSFKLLLFILFLILTGCCDVFSSSFTKYKRKARIFSESATISTFVERGSGPGIWPRPPRWGAGVGATLRSTFFLVIEDSQETKRKWIKEFKKDEQLKHTISYFRMWICVGDLFDHRVCWRQSNLVLSGTFLDCLNNCLSSKISDTCSLLYKFNFFGRFNHAHFHGRLTDIYEFCMR